MNTYVIGSMPRLSVTFAVGGVATDPTTVTFKIKIPAGTITTYVYGVDSQLAKDSTGVYHVDWTTAAEGIHAWRMAGTGACVAADEQLFAVRDSRFTP
jgi:hypothetical protein